MFDFLTFHHNGFPKPGASVVCFSSASMLFTCIFSSGPKAKIPHCHLSNNIKHPKYHLHHPKYRAVSFENPFSAFPAFSRKLIQRWKAEDDWCRFCFRWPGNGFPNIPVTFANLVKAKLILAGRLVLAIQEFGQLTIAHAGDACTKFFFFFGFLDMNFFDKSH